MRLNVWKGDDIVDNFLFGLGYTFGTYLYVLPIGFLLLMLFVGWKLLFVPKDPRIPTQRKKGAL